MGTVYAGALSAPPAYVPQNQTPAYLPPNRPQYAPNPPPIIIQTAQYAPNPLQNQTIIFGHKPLYTTCQFCQKQALTQVTHEIGLGNLLAYGVGSLICLLCGWVALLIDDLKDTTHQCVNCKKVLYVKK